MWVCTCELSAGACDRGPEVTGGWKLLNMGSGLILGSLEKQVHEINEEPSL